MCLIHFLLKLQVTHHEHEKLNQTTPCAVWLSFWCSTWPSPDAVKELVTAALSSVNPGCTGFVSMMHLQCTMIWWLRSPQLHLPKAEFNTKGSTKQRCSSKRRRKASVSWVFFFNSIHKLKRSSSKAKTHLYFFCPCFSDWLQLRDMEIFNSYPG